MAAFGNAGLGQFGQDNYFAGTTGEGKGIGQFILGSVLSQLGVPPQVNSILTGQKPSIPNQPQQAIPPLSSTNDAMQPSQPGMTMQNNDQNSQAEFSQNFKNLFSHLPTFGNK